MNSNECKRNLSLYRFYVIFNEPLFWGPILITSLQKLAHMPLQDIYYMESVVLCIAVLCDIPFGALADILGRKRTIIMGRIFLFMSAFFFAIMSNPLEAWIGNVLWAIGFTMQSGADSAFLYDTLRECGRQSEYKRIEGRLVGFRLFLIAFCSLVTGWLVNVNLAFPLYLGLPFVLVPLIISFFWKEPVHIERYSMQKQLNILKRGSLFVFRSTQVRWMIGFFALMATTSKLWFFTYNPYFELVGIEISHYGFIFFLFNIVAWLSSHYAYKLENVLGERKSIVGMILCVSVPILIMGFIPIWSFAYFAVIQNLVRGFMRPFVGDYMNKYIGTDIRATVLSAQSSVSNLIAIVGLAVFGFFIANVNLLNALIILGFASLIIGIFSYESYKKMIMGNK